MAVRGWLGGGEESSVVFAYLESSGGVSNMTRLSHHPNHNEKACFQSYTVYKVSRCKTTNASDMLRASTGPLSPVCASLVSRTRSYLDRSARLITTARSSAAQVEDHHPQQRRSSTHFQRRQHPLQRHQKRRDSGVGVANVQTCIDYGVRRKWYWTAYEAALCACVVAVLCYVNLLDGDFVYTTIRSPSWATPTSPARVDDTGHCHRRRFWINDFWGRPMADPRSHKSYQPLTVLTFK
ncbi:hypothetical protein HPB51_026785 [Rhipicephalus microplus]|uniref:Uncharacterized protein n=1 Tax=Rhipicephalus microplus TaxID=6941 RepID=A0A9J6D256_RHIMP|nr:hypothetical protein HPB51_026785 [Rhipicephalus microplus]